MNQVEIAICSILALLHFLAELLLVSIRFLYVISGSYPLWKPSRAFGNDDSVFPAYSPICMKNKSKWIRIGSLELVKYQ